MNEESTALREYTDIVYRKKWLIVAVFVSVFLSTLYYVQRQQQLYASGSTLYLEYADRTPGIATVVSLGGPATGGRQRPLEFYLGIFDSRSFREQVDDGLIHYAIRLGMDPAEAERRADIKLQIFPGEHEGYYTIRSEATSPDIGYAADSIATYLFVDRCRELAQLEARTMVRFIEMQFDSARVSLARAEDALQDFRRANNLLQLSQTGTVEEGLPMEYVRLLEGYYDARKERQTAQATLDATTRAGQLIQQSYDSVATDRDRRANPALEMYEVRESIRKASTELQIKEFQERSFQTQLQTYEATHPELSNVTLTYMRLDRERDIYQRLGNLLLERREELRVQASSETGGVKVIDRPTYGIAVPSRARVTLVLGLVIGLVFGMGAAFVWELFDSNIKSSAEVSDVLGVSAIGSIPSIGMSREPRMNGRPGSRGRSMLISEVSPKDPVAEAYRTLRTSLMYSVGDPALHTIVISSAGQAEGKSVTTANLGITCAQMGQRTLILDCDLRRPVQHSLFRLEREGGLTEFLLQDLDLADVIKPSGAEGLDVITAGIAPPNPAPLLASRAMADRLAQLRKGYDLVIMDSPPIIAVTDAVILGKLANGVLLVVRCAVTPRAAARHALSILTGANVPVLGAILNDIDISRHYGGYYYYSYYHHYYGGYYGSEVKETRSTKEAS